jgi:ATP-dependent Clp protease ATP-binding subunit ClpC
MVERLSREVRTIRTQADIVARATGRATGSVHYLVAMFVVECPARDLLAETGIGDQTVLDTFERMAERDEPAEALADIDRHAQRLAESSGLTEMTSMVLLASLLRVRDCLACRVLERAGVAVPSLRAKVIGQVNLHVDLPVTGTRPSVRPPVEPRPELRPDIRSDNRLDPRPELRSDGRFDTRSHLAAVPPRSFSGPAASPSSTLPAARPAQAPSGASHGVVPPSPPRPAPPTGVSHAGSAASAPQQPGAPAQPSTTAAAAATPGKLRSTFALTAEAFPTLVEVGRNLTEAALHGQIDTIVGRDALIDAVIDVLLMRHANNPCLIGEAGVGKTAIAEGLALRLAGRTDLYGRLGSAVVVEVPVSSLVAGTQLRGAFSERMRKLRDEVAKAEGQVIVFIDEIHTLMGAGTGDGPLDAANDLKSALSRGKFPLIGATTKSEYQRHIEADPAMDRRFQVIEVPEPGTDEAIAILAGVAPVYAKHHGVVFQHDALVSAVHLSKRFITDSALPAKALTVIDRAGAQAQRGGQTQVQVHDVARAVHQLTGVPMERLLADERGRIRDLASDLQQRICGHDRAMERMARRIQRNYAGFSGDRPLASFLLVGAAGTGKTETARALAQALFIHGDALVRLDMADYAEAHSVSRLIGSPPGYVGHAQAGLLAQALQKRPYRVLLFDEVDRAAPEVLALLLQLLDLGRITDNHGHVIDVRNSILVLTTQLGAEVLAAGRRRAIGFGADWNAPAATAADDAAAEAQDSAALERAKSRLPPELWGRIDDKLVFRPLDAHAARTVVRRTVDGGAERLFQARSIRYRVDETVIDWLLDGGLDPALGVRPLRAKIEASIESFITDGILEGRLKTGAEVTLTLREGKLALVQDDGWRATAATVQ